MSLLDYLDDSSSSDDAVDFKAEETLKNELRTIKTQDSKLKLPPPKKPSIAPPPPAPIEVPKIQASDIKQESGEEKEIIELNSEEFKKSGVELAEKNMMIKDRTQYSGVGYDRSKSQLTYLAELDQQTNGAFEQQMRSISRSLVAAKKMYGW
ncbi:hypothetical protein M9Y10_023534 [Tritrichomonas musculus]|uniref:Uncharacterized protein n=1 Tax=Tritrichomonas musculus TaxID=1915356 RepID=A0ABR2KW00_9EUKA